LAFWSLICHGYRTNISACRLDAALQEMAMGAKAVDVAFDYGFDTYAGFYKAFVRMYGISPKKYL